MKKILLLSITTILYFSSPVYSNSEMAMGSITGRVLEAATLHPLPGATVIIVGTNLGTTTDENGEYIIPDLDMGSYQLRATSIGFKSETKSDIIVNSVKPAVVDFILQESITELEAVTITSDYFQKDPHEFTSVTSFSYEEIRRAPGGFEDVVRALSVLPGVAQADAGRNDLIVRGGAPSENLYILDGIQIPNINHFGSQGATGGPLSYIDLNFVKGSTFSTGGFSALYGEKLSSVLSIDLRDGRKDRVGGKATVAATQFGLNAEGPLGSKGNFIFSARRSYLDFVFKAAGFGFVPEYYDYLAKANYSFDNNNSISYLLIGAIDNVKYFNDTEDQRYDNSRILGSDQLQYATGINFRHLFNSGLYRLSLSRNFVDYNTSQIDTLQNPIFLNKSKEQENILNGELVYRLPSGDELNFGATFKFIRFSSDIKLPTFETSFGDTLEITSLSVKDNYYRVGAYTQYTGYFLERFRYNAGLRFDFFNAINEKITVSPRLSLSYLLSDITTLNLSTGIYFQNPSYIWLAADERNKDLKNIRADHFVLGLEHRLREDVQLKVEGFYKEYKNYPASTLRNYLVLANTGAGFAGSDDNFSSFGLEHLVSEGSGDVKGFEFLIQKKSSKNSTNYGILSITYSEAYFKALDGIKRSGTYDQKWILNLTGGIIFNDKWEASSKFRFSTGKPYTPFNPDGTQNISDYNSARLGINHSLDLRVDRRWNFEKWSLVTYIDIQNIYNRKNISFPRWDAREMKEDFSSSIGILPSIGITAEI